MEDLTLEFQKRSLIDSFKHSSTDFRPLIRTLLIVLVGFGHSLICSDGRSYH